MKVLITGGTGFIGSRLALRCLADGNQVRVLGQENTAAEATNRKQIEEAGAEVVLGSVTEGERLVEVVDGVDTVFHLAAAQHEMNVPDQRFRDVNIGGTRHMLEASVGARVKRFVHGSTIGVYGKPNGTLSEESLCAPDNIYGTTKLAGEQLVLSYSKRLPVVVIRIPEVYGPGDRRLLKLFRSIDKRLFFMIGKGKNLHHVIYIGDLIDGLLAAARAPDAVGEVILLAGNEAVSTREMVATIAATLGRKPPRFVAPLPVFVVLAAAMETTLRPLGIQPPLHRRRLDFFRKSFTLSAAKASRLMAFQPNVNFAEGAHRTAKWYRSMGYL